jgi:hypothetical protein
VLTNANASIDTEPTAMGLRPHGLRISAVNVATIHEAYCTDLRFIDLFIVEPFNGFAALNQRRPNRPRK